MKYSIGCLVGLMMSVPCLQACDEDGGFPEDEIVQEEVQFLTDDEEEALPIEKIEFEDETTVAFFEEDTGEISVYEWGPIGSTPKLSRELSEANLSAPDLYERLTGTSAPRVLIDAQLRSDMLRRQEGDNEAEDLQAIEAPRSASLTKDGDIVSDSSAILYYSCDGPPYSSYDEWFNCNFCNLTTNAGFDYDITWMWRTGNGSFTEDDMKWSMSAVAVHGGNGLSFTCKKRTWSSWSTTFSATVPYGWWMRCETHMSRGFFGNYYDFDTRSNVTSADGVDYHWCSSGHSRSGFSVTLADPR